MFDAWSPINAEECFRQDLKAITTDIRLAEQDTGDALAYSYRGTDSDMAMAIETMHVYAMVRPDEGSVQKLTTIDYFLPTILLTDIERKNLTEQGFECVGFIDNYYNDVFGLCAGVIDETTERSAESFAVATYSRLQSITAEDARAMREEWFLQSPPKIQDAKEEMIRDLTQHKNALLTSYIEYTQYNPQPE